MKSKLLLQKLWQLKVDWDQPVPDEIKISWDEFLNSLLILHKINIPRFVLSDTPKTIEIHCFSDASQVGYGACIYTRTISLDGVVTVNLLCSKSRAAPLKPVTIPRLELCAALLASRLCKTVVESIRYVPDRVVYWSDSSIVLGWLSSDTSKLKTFVANRVGEIKENTQPSSWRYVPTADNPADLISRGVSMGQLQNSNIWWHGPSFLLRPELDWPVLQNKSIELPEIKSVATTIIVEPLIDFSRFSQFNRLKRTIAYVKRFVHNAKNPKNKRLGNFSTDELNDAQKLLYFMSQQESFPIDYKTLHDKKPLSPKSKMLSLSPYIDEDNLIRVGGRIDASDCPFDQRHPILLDSAHHLCKLIFRHEHIRNMHAGPQLLLATIRQTLWAINGRRLARNVARSCVRCRRVQGNTLVPKMGDLPRQRINANFPFVSCGIDMAGPFYTINRKGRGAKLTKTYLCLFICLRYKCVHLEAVSDLTKDAFIMTLRRFISRRGRPVEIFSDNGRNFVGAANEIKQLFEQNNTLAEFAAQEGLKFVTTPSLAPHFGGIWESNIKSAKFHVKRVMGNSHLTFEEITTLFSQIEAILNSRPLCPLSPSPDDFLYLSPGHFLIGRPLNALPSTNLEDLPQNRLQRYAQLEQIRQHFWRRWQREYISELQTRTKWKQDKTRLKVGDLVLLCEDSLPPLCWRTGRVAKLFPGPDGIVRVADVQTTTGCYRRPLVRLCPLLDEEDLKG
ncbi:hypothetical protein ABMA28_015888 [Loxostege sticticalis]|uniref:Integrase catalytic domain-containing protein n=1 Tax=Loxostege sticticalis TaxID=481309 RepID=A0ABD0TBH0_LOXSC